MDSSTDWAVWVEEPIVGNGPTWITTGGRVITGSKAEANVIASSVWSMRPELRQYDGDGPKVNILDTTWKEVLGGRGIAANKGLRTRRP